MYLLQRFKWDTLIYGLLDAIKDGMLWSTGIFTSDVEHKKDASFFNTLLIQVRERIGSRAKAEKGSSYKLSD